MPDFRDHRARRHFQRRILYMWRCRRYWLAWLLWLPFLPFHYLEVLIKRLDLYTTVREEYGGVRISEGGLRRSDSFFVECTKDALKLVETHDPRRFRRIQREVRFIANRPGAMLGFYDATNRLCGINFTCLEEWASGWLSPEYRGRDEYLWFIAYYAATIIHEATHGTIASGGMPYLPATRVRIERLCTREEQRFAARLPQDRYDFANDLIEPFDEKRWYPYWKG
jgi:hypothetical protein